MYKEKKERHKMKNVIIILATVASLLANDTAGKMHDEDLVEPAYKVEVLQIA